MGDYVKAYGDDYEFYIDIDDIKLLENHYWTLSRGYMESRDKGKLIRLHRVIMDAPAGKVVDHIDHDKLNNRKSNLRVCNHSRNGQNSQISINNASGVTGVCWHKKANKWTAQIKHQYDNHYLGLFADFDEAVKARLKAEAVYFGEFAPQKHLYKKYGIEVGQLIS